jgi:hypothetical protein
VIQLIDQEDDLDMIDRNLWSKLKVDGKFLNELTITSMKEKLAIQLKGERQLLMDFIERNKPIAYLRDREIMNSILEYKSTKSYNTKLKN